MPTRKKKLPKIIALVPCYNEELGIGAVIKGFPTEKVRTAGYDLEIVVIDNNSKDNTAKISAALGATVLHEPQKGKGNAMRHGFDYALAAGADYIVMLDGDNTYRPAEILRMIEPLNSGFCNVVIGSRLGGRMSEGSMKFLNRAGNWVYSHLVRYFYRVNVTDALTGYFAWTHAALERMRPHLKSNGFAIEMEMVTKMARLGEEIYSVPISYDDRAGHTNLRPFYDGSRILLMFTRNLFWKPELPKAFRIAFVSDAVMPYNMGGKEKRLYEISKRLASRGYDVTIYTMKWWEGKSNEKDLGGVRLRAICKRYPLYSGDRRSIFQALAFGVATFKLLFVEFDALDVDHMPFFPLFSARIVTWLRGKKLYATWHEVWGRNYWLSYLGGASGFIGYIIEAMSFKLPNVIISNSNHTTNRLRSAGFQGEIKTVPLGVDLESIYAAKKARTKSDIIFVGRLLSHKNADMLVEAINVVKKHYPEVICKIVGDGPERAKVATRIRELKLDKNIEIIDLVKEHSTLYSLLKASKMLVLPSVREGFGLVAVEANAAGLPVITTSHPDNATKDLIKEGINGYLAEPLASSIAEKILRVLDDYSSMRPQSMVKQYDWETVAENIKQVFE
ncbi:MAG TPA: glycosyltransferase [Candidatus Paceibacterota bacterium]|nr:glycosyltransferase [Candidatus Paceibacterota bacterium]